MLYFDIVKEKAKEYGVEIQRDGTIVRFCYKDLCIRLMSLADVVKLLQIIEQIKEEKK